MKTIITSRYFPKSENKSQTKKSKIDSSTNLPVNLEKFKEKLSSRSDLIIYEDPVETI